MYSLPVYIQYLYSMLAYVCTVLTRLHLLYALCFILISLYSLPLMHVRISHSFINPSHTPLSTHHTLLHQPITHCGMPCCLILSSPSSRYIKRCSKLQWMRLTSTLVLRQTSSVLLQRATSSGSRAKRKTRPST